MTCLAAHTCRSIHFLIFTIQVMMTRGEGRVREGEMEGELVRRLNKPEIMRDVKYGMIHDKRKM